MTVFNTFGHGFQYPIKTHIPRLVIGGQKPSTTTFESVLSDGHAGRELMTRRATGEQASTESELIFGQEPSQIAPRRSDSLCSEPKNDHDRKWKEKTTCRHRIPTNSQGLDTCDYILRVVTEIRTKCASKASKFRASSYRLDDGASVACIAEAVATWRVAGTIKNGYQGNSSGIILYVH